MHPWVSSDLLRSLPSDELCFLVLSLPTVTASAGVRYYGRSDSSPHRTSGVWAAASFRASTLCPDARSGSAPFWRSLVTRCAVSGIFQPSTRERSPGFAPRFFRTAPSGKTLGASIVVWCSLPTTAGGFITLRSLATLAALSTGSTSRLTAQFFASWPTAPSLARTHCHSTTSPDRASTRIGL